MPVTTAFHPEALLEFAEAADFYLHEASPVVAQRFASVVESAIASLTESPLQWKVIEEPEIRRCVLQHFPYVVYYRWEAHRNRIVIYAVMHSSRKPGYWRHRTA